MRILFIDFHTDNMNPICRQWPLLFHYFGNVEFFGPGFQREDTLRSGVAEFVKKKGPFDFVVCSENIYLNTLPEMELEYQARSYKRQYWLGFDIRDALRQVDGIYQEFLDLDATKLVTTIMFDNYQARPAVLDLLTRFDGHLISLGDPFIAPLKELRNLDDEGFGGKATDNWYQFVQQNTARTVSIPFFVTEDEFNLSPLCERKIPWSVVGAQYAARRLAREALSREKIQWNGRWLNYAVSAVDRLAQIAGLQRGGIVFLNHLFRRSIETSRYSYTCGSGLGYPVRKFFEIPALGAVLVCRPCNGFSELGFFDGENAIVAEPSEVVDVHKELERDPARAQSIADAGRWRVWQSHSAQARARQLAACLPAIKARTFAGTRWHNGEFSAVELTDSRAFVSS